jgi:alpha-L-fucosidase
VQQYAIEIYKGGTWLEIARGEAIGHKRIHHFSRVTASRVRLNILSSSAEARIRELQIFDSTDDGN